MNHVLTGGDKPLPMTVDNVGFLLDRLGQDCSPLQYLRELTQNAIEAVLRTGEPGQINWDVDWISFDLGDGPMKVCIVDTGDGMTGEEMIKFINQLSSSGSQQSFTGNYGVGAKIAAATKKSRWSDLSVVEKRRRVHGATGKEPSYGRVRAKTVAA